MSSTKTLKERTTAIRTELNSLFKESAPKGSFIVRSPTQQLTPTQVRAFQLLRDLERLQIEFDASLESGQSMRELGANPMLVALTNIRISLGSPQTGEYIFLTVLEKQALEAHEKIVSAESSSASASGGGGGGGGSGASGGGGGEPEPEPKSDPDFVPFSKLTSDPLYAQKTSDLALSALEKLYNGITYAAPEFPPMMRMMVRMKQRFDKEAAKKLLADLDNGQEVYVDSFQDHCLKVLLAPSGISTAKYDMTHGPGRAKKVLSCDY
jgi:hypothetical protein